ncbi:hypothetical protein [Amaricoccus macauensis]|uniref:hypothetical protein n=1 Tax=Amaricoccus macauensis TaxID=57001 RepID=UPI003C7E4CD2
MTRIFKTAFFTALLITAAGMSTIASARDAGERTRTVKPASNLVAEARITATDATTYAEPAAEEQTLTGRNCARQICERPGR